MRTPPEAIGPLGPKTASWSVTVSSTLSHPLDDKANPRSASGPLAGEPAKKLNARRGFPNSNEEEELSLGS